MKNIEDIIRNNRDLFDTAEPQDGHFERFCSRLEERFPAHTMVRRSIVPYLLKAAVVTLLVTLSSLWTWEHFLKPGRDRMTLGDVSPQYREVENYYMYQVNLMSNEIASLDENDEGQKQMLLAEMKSIDSVYIQLQKDLRANPNDERIINAMIEHYQTKLEVMNYIVNQLKIIRNDNQTRKAHENSGL